MTAPTTGPSDPEVPADDVADGLFDDEAAQLGQDRYERSLGWGCD